MRLLLVVYGLMVAFGVGIRKAAGGNRRLRIAGNLVIALGVMAYRSVSRDGDSD
jgi:hypothetical protein